MPSWPQFGVKKLAASTPPSGSGQPMRESLAKASHASRYLRHRGISDHLCICADYAA